MTDNNSLPTEKKTPWFLGRTAVIWGLLLVGPFALVMLWPSPEFKKGTKIIITIVALLLTYLSYLYTPVLLDTLTKRLQELQASVKS